MMGEIEHGKWRKGDKNKQKLASSERSEREASGILTRLNTEMNGHDVQRQRC